MAKDKLTGFEVYRGDCFMIAKDFRYPDSVFKKIKAAKSSGELSEIMLEAMRDDEKKRD